LTAASHQLFFKLGFLGLFILAGRVGIMKAKALTALTKRRRQVATLVSNGLSNRQIAKKLGLAEGTVKIHLHGIYEKLNIHSRTELAQRLKGAQPSEQRSDYASSKSA
jgi:DNA-binding NarL/FixJ family response regulator